MARTELMFLTIPAGLALFDWVALIKGWRTIDFIAKPGVMLALILWALSVSGGELLGSAAIWFMAGLVFSGLGDVFLMLPKERFIAGLGAFFLAHIGYTVAFSGRGISLTPGLALVTGLEALAAFYLLARLRANMRTGRLAKLWRPVVLYACVICIMLFAGVQTLFNPLWRPLPAILIAGGALLFFISDGILAWNRFITSLKRGQLVVRIFYQVGQLLMTAGFFYDRFTV